MVLLWYASSLFERFLLGILMLVALESAILVLASGKWQHPKWLVLGALLITFLFFSANTLKHVSKNILPATYRSIVSPENLLPNNKENLSVSKL